MITNEASELAPGTLLAGRYRLGDLLGRGGMANVYRAHDERLRRTVAVKILAPQLAADDRFTLRFTDEARVAASVSHPNLVHVYDAGSDGGVRFIVMELLPEAPPCVTSSRLAAGSSRERRWTWPWGCWPASMRCIGPGGSTAT